MHITIRLTRTLAEYALRDLRRPHQYASERVGFLYGKRVEAEEALILMTHYRAVADERYINDPTVGARIDGGAIRNAMQEAIDTKTGLFHTHIHDFGGRLDFSAVDNRELPKLVPAFQAAGGANATGLFLFGQKSAIADVWLPGGAQSRRASRICVVGFPFEFLGAKP
jgi:hypothetical protein